ncbi:RNAse (barnase) inhibitor barstar [Saccharothrix tamanrassetensis]|uniref:RNAse (Barnase) inhibitor barstar n=1 Tax=Saccharothrix tamanrassetensis TaxID=1051531 RepID=A0A841CQJ8_9PSEU|nr:barstar family protein [Saccharothrix tamanrassetensis]MBB5957776.1 RNAse (barnase) inhibitor barstar [Saccharothrix tamanrassetensis]
MIHLHVVRDGARSKSAALAAIGTAMEFPDYYGQNLDALYDCLTDLSWLPPGEHVLVWEGGNEDVASVLADAEAAMSTGERTFSVRYPD